MVVISFMQGKKCTILVKWPTKTTMAILPSKFGKSITRLMVICCHTLLGKGIGCKTLVLF